MKSNKLLALLKLFKGELVLVFVVGVGVVVLLVTPAEHRHEVVPVLKTVIQLLLVEGIDVSVE